MVSRWFFTPRKTRMCMNPDHVASGDFVLGRDVQGVVTYMSPVEALATVIKFFDRQKVCLIAWLFPSEALDRLISRGSKVTLQPHIVDCWFLAVWRSPWSLDRPPKRALIVWFNFDPGGKRFYTGHISDYPLTFFGIMVVWIPNNRSLGPRIERLC